MWLSDICVVYYNRRTNIIPTRSPIFFVLLVECLFRAIVWTVTVIICFCCTGCHDVAFNSSFLYCSLRCCVFVCHDTAFKANKD